MRPGEVMALLGKLHEARLIELVPPRPARAGRPAATGFGGRRCQVCQYSPDREVLYAAIAAAATPAPPLIYRTLAPLQRRPAPASALAIAGLTTTQRQGTTTQRPRRGRDRPRATRGHEWTG